LEADAATVPPVLLLKLLLDPNDLSLAIEGSGPPDDFMEDTMESSRGSDKPMSIVSSTLVDAVAMRAMDAAES
jgi:hypothetical protein